MRHLFKLQVIFLLSAASLTLHAEPELSTQSGVMRLFSSGSGYVVNNSEFLWSDDWGTTWSVRTTQVGRKADPLIIGGAFFGNESQGWIESHDSSGAGRIWISRTNDKGKHWVTRPVEINNPILRSGFAGESMLAFTDRGHGWLQLRQTESTRAVAALFVTVNGGQRWTKLPPSPTFGSMIFIPEKIGWLVGGLDSSGLYKTVDGGLTWFRQDVDVPSEFRKDAVTSYGVPHFQGVHGVLTVTFLQGVKGSTVAVYSSDDSGRRWELSTKLSMDSQVIPAVSV